MTKRYGGFVAVDDMTFSVGRGEILGLIGPNGAGKTTMFDLVAGSVPPSAGRISIEGIDVSREGAHRRIRRGLGRTFQIPRPFRTSLSSTTSCTPGRARRVSAPS